MAFSRWVAAAALFGTIAACSAGPSEAVGVDTAEARTAPVVRLPGDITQCPGEYQTRAPVEGLNGNYVIAEQTREFAMLLPPGDPTTPHPILIAFNGTFDNGPGMIRWGRLADFAARGFIVVAPSSIGNGTLWPVWDAMRRPNEQTEPNKDLDYFDSLVACVAAHHPVDANRVYVGGHSAGGIFANYVIQRRSKLIAGGIVGSGLFSYTSPVPAPVLDPMFLLVTWGGDNDEIAGFGMSFNFVTEVSMASTFYDGAPNVTEVNCRGDNVGHVWLKSSNPYMIDLLLAHPKGHAALEGPLPPMPAGARATCGDAPFVGLPPPAIACGDAAMPSGCQSFCQLTADCVAENGTMEPSLREQLAQLGFSTQAGSQCGACVERCATHGSKADQGVLACFQRHQSGARCGQGIEGAFPFVDAVNECCAGHADSSLCVDVCQSLLSHPIGASFFTTCESLGTR